MGWKFEWDRRRGLEDVGRTGGKKRISRGWDCGRAGWTDGGMDVQKRETRFE